MRYANEYEAAFKFFDLDNKLAGFQTLENTFDKTVFENHEHIVLYHSTSDVFLDAIKADGIKPNGITGNLIADDLETDPAIVYLHNWTCGNQKLYGRRAVDEFGGNPITLECVVRLDDLAPDTNCISPPHLELIADDKLQQIIEGVSFGQFACESMVSMLTRIFDQNENATLLT